MQAGRKCCNDAKSVVLSLNGLFAGSKPSDKLLYGYYNIIRILQYNTDTTILFGHYNIIRILHSYTDTTLLYEY